MPKLLLKPLLFILLSSLLFGQDSLSLEPVTLEKIKLTFENSQYAEVVDLVKSDLDHFPQQAPERLEILLKYLALSQASQGLDTEARRTFTTLLLIHPAYQFEPGEISPKIKILFDSVVPDSTQTRYGTALTPAYLIKTDRRSDLILKSIVFPGWGQRELGARYGYFLSTLFSAAVIATGVSAVMTENTRQDYLNAYTPGDIESSYASYNQWYRLRNSLLAVTLLTYTFNLADISFSTR